ncbi:serine/threonine protein kinase [Bacteriovoracaceae bacterium]|nr:serine/threonine protein kinase [Bacteriovoracaceae bacterium]
MAKHVWGDDDTQYFFQLSPEKILDAIDILGLRTTGRCLPLNSLENRVYEIEVDDSFVVAKFYRPGRWTKEQILEEHQFLYDLEAAEIPVITPMKFNGESLFQLEGHDLWYTIFPKKGGRIPQEMNREQLEIMGRLLARLHNVGQSKVANHRLTISPETFGTANLEFLLKEDTIPSYIRNSYETIVRQIITLITPLFQGITYQRIHGDCHWGNILWREQEGPFFVDFDDMLMGPAVQDVWLVVPGNDEFALKDRHIFLDAYSSMKDFDYQELKLIEPLRVLRYIHFASWMAKRWGDPAFKMAFPQFGSDMFWETQLNDVREQLSVIHEQLSTGAF